MTIKSIATTRAGVLALTLLFSLTSCKEEPNSEPTPEEALLSQIAGTWTLTAASLNQKDVSASFPQLKVVISADQHITVTNAVPPVWPTTGTFELESVGNIFRLIREDGLEITITQPDANHLVLRFLYDAAAMGGKTNSVSGEFTFAFVKN